MENVPKKLVCIECPKSCALSVDIENCRVVRVSGEKCPKGKEYAIIEVENPTRVLTSAVLAEGLSVRMVPVRTDRPIPKPRLLEAMGEIKKIRVTKRLRAGDIIARNFLGLGVNLITTRDIL